MDPALRERVHDDLKGVVKGKLLFDDLSRTLYSTDASPFEIEPLGVVVPRDEEDVQALVRYAGENQASLIARRGGVRPRRRIAWHRGSLSILAAISALF